MDYMKKMDMILNVIGIHTKDVTTFDLAAEAADDGSEVAAEATELDDNETVSSGVRTDPEPSDTSEIAGQELGDNENDVRIKNTSEPKHVEDQNASNISSTKQSSAITNHNGAATEHIHISSPELSQTQSTCARNGVVNDP